jgi:hypothetical protein
VISADDHCEKVKKGIERGGIGKITGNVSKTSNGKI